MLAVASVTQPIGTVKPDLEGPEGDFVHGRALLHCRTLLLGEKLKTFQQSTETARS